MTRPATARPAQTGETVEGATEVETRPGYAAAVLTYVRTPGGVVQVEKGQSLPVDADDEHLRALVGAGAAVNPATLVDDED